MKEYGRAEVVKDRLGLSPLVGQKIAAIVTFTGAIEHYLERALWTLRGVDPTGIRPDTDNKVITDLIGILQEFAATMESSDARAMIEEWCVATRAGFVIRNNIVHGAPARLGDTLAYMRNPRWHGEIRKREFGDFWAEEHTLGLVQEALAVLMRIILQLSKGGEAPAEVATPLAVRAVRTARSVLGEFADPFYNPSYEKY